MTTDKFGKTVQTVIDTSYAAGNMLRQGVKDFLPQSGDLNEKIVGPIIANCGISRESFWQTMTVMRNTWDAQTIEGLLQGKVTLTEEVVNACLALQTPNTADNEAPKLVFHEQEVEIISTTKEWGKIVLRAKLLMLRHNRDESVMRMEILDKKLPDKKMLSWLFSRISLGFLEKILGPLNIGDGITVQTIDNTVTVYFRERLRTAASSSRMMFGVPLLDSISVSKAVVHSGSVELSCRLELGDALGSGLALLVSAMKQKKTV